MNRFAYSQLLQWKNAGNSNLLILGGVSSVGKTSLVKQFSMMEFNRDIWIDCIDGNLEGTDNNFDIERLTIFDNINGNREVLKTLSDLANSNPDSFFVGIDPFARDGRGESFNLNANYIVLYPLSFEEFLYNVDKNIFNKLSAVKDIYQIDPSLNKTLFKYLYEYIIIGGMPSVVNNYIENGFVFENIRAEQNRIVDKLLSSLAVYYKKTEYKNIESILKIILPLLIRNNNKFKINDFGKSRRFSSFSKFIDITKKLHLVYTSYNIKEKSTEINNSSFNLYLFDTGLLGAFGNIPYSIYGDNLDLGNQFVLGLVKNYAATESFSSFILPIYNWSQNMSKVELFFINKNKKSLGIEIKNNKSGKLKSLDILHEVYPEAKLIRMNNSYPMDKGQIKVLPLYTIRSIIRNFSN